MRLHSLLLLSLTSVLPILSCNSIVGLSRFSVEEEKGAGGSGSGAAGAAGSGGSGQGQGGDDLDASVLDVVEAAVGECETNAQCTERATRNAVEAGADAGTVPAMCVKPEHRCVALLSEDCDRITG